MSAKMHLTLSGSMAGQVLCGAPRVAGGLYAHYSLTPVESAEVRAKLCPACLREVALSYREDGEEVPAYLAEYLEGGSVA